MAKDGIKEFILVPKQPWEEVTNKIDKIHGNFVSEQSPDKLPKPDHTRDKLKRCEANAAKQKAISTSNWINY